ncbi:Polyol transporter 5 [Linum perenne]
MHSPAEIWQKMLVFLEPIRIRSPKPTPAALWISLVYSVPFFIFGFYDVAMFDSVNSIAGDMHLTGLQPHLLVEVMSRVPNFGGACVAGVAANFYGRAYTAGFGTALYTVGVLVVSISRNYVACAVGHSIAGFGIGMGLVVGPIYIAEIAPANVRSFLGYTPQAMMSLGMAFASGLMSGAVWIGHPYVVWRVIVGISALPSAVFTWKVLLHYPDTPCWLVMRGRINDANRLLRFFGADVDETYNRMRQLRYIAGIEQGLEGNEVRGAPGRITEFWESLTNTTIAVPIHRVMLTTVGLMFAQEATLEALTVGFTHFVIGINDLASYFSFSLSDFVLASVRVIVTTVSSHWGNGPGGRRAMFLVSIALVGCLLGGLGATTIAYARSHAGRNAGFATLLAVETILFEAGIGSGLGPIPWMYGPESFPLQVRAPCIGFCIGVKFLIRFALDVIPTLFPYSFVGEGYRFLVSSGFVLLSFVLSCIYVRDCTGDILKDEMD